LRRTKNTTLAAAIKNTKVRKKYFTMIANLIYHMP